MLMNLLLVHVHCRLLVTMSGTYMMDLQTAMILALTACILEQCTIRLKQVQLQKLGTWMTALH